MTQKSIFLIAILAIALCFNSCKKSSSSSSSSGYYLRVTINGQNFSREGEVNGFSFSDQQGCVNNKPYELANVSQIDAASYFLDVMIHHYQNYSDFNGTATGSHTIHDYYLLLTSGVNPCNMDLMIGCDDRRQASEECRLQSNSLVNNITNISRVSETSTNVKYNIEGNFSCNFKNSINQLIPVTGNYKTYFEVLK